MKKKPLVVVAMSGGVDSSVVAAMLVEQGYEVVGMMLRMWSRPGMEGENRCCTPDSIAQARRISAKLGFPFYALDARDLFKEKVVQEFLEAHRSGKTPNPCMLCNRDIKWGFLLERALAVGAEYLATGHYVRVRTTENGEFQLLRGKDLQKDQSYFLSQLSQYQLSHSLFPLGEFTKSEVREMARRHGLEVAEKEESQDLCFLGNDDVRHFLENNAPEIIKPGLIVNRSGDVVGTHQGLANYTIGQRKGLEIAGKNPMYVVSKNMNENTLMVGSSQELGMIELFANNLNWISGELPDFSFSMWAKIRYRSTPVLCRVILLPDQRVKVVFEESLRDITPGQFIVFYNSEDVVLGSGLIMDYGENSG
jgi:tRNA-specific 2-thiouridylase